MASGGVKLCDVCSLRHNTTDACEWCPECDEYLCIKCKEHHALAKSSRKHETILLDTLSKLPSFVKDVQLVCSEHDDRFVYFCHDHESPSCVECVKNYHEKCRNLSSMQNVIQDIKSSTSFSDLENLISDIVKNYENIIDDRKDFLLSLEMQKETLAGEIECAKLTAIEYINKLAMGLTEELNATINKQKLELDKLLEDLASRRANAAEKQENIELIKASASDFQAFMVIQQLSLTYKAEESEIKQLVQSDSLNWNEVELIPTKLMAFSSLGKLASKSDSSKVKLVDHKLAQAQLPEKTLYLRNIRVKKQFETHVKDAEQATDILGCSILPNGKLICTDRNNARLVVFKANGDFEQNLSLPFKPVRLATIDDITVAVTSYEEKPIHFVNFETGEIKKSIHLKIECRSIICKPPQLIVESFRKGFVILDLEGNLLQQISMNFMDEKYHTVAFIGENLYYVDAGSNKLCCCDLKGNTIWEFKNQKLKKPYALTTDGLKVLFVGGAVSKNVFAVSADRKHFKQIIWPMDNLQNLVASHYCARRKKLLLATIEGHLIVFDVV